MRQGGKIQQVLLNLLTNAAQAMNSAGIEKPKIVKRLKPEKGQARIEIQDNSPGMKREVRKRIFEPILTTKTVGLGTGLGLSVSYFIITDNHGGTMSVESTPGKGACFIIHLPEKEKKEKAFYAEP